MRQLIFCLISSVILISCAGSEYVVKYNGDEVEITTSSDILYEAELIALTEEEIIILLNYEDENYYENEKPKVASINLDQIKSITVKGYSDKEWKSHVMVLQIAPAVILGLTMAAFSENVGAGLAFSLVLTIPGWITYLIFDAASPDPPQWNSDVNDKESFKQLNIYARFPIGITQSQLEELLKYYNQKEIVKLN